MQRLACSRLSRAVPAAGAVAAVAARGRSQRARNKMGPQLFEERMDALQDPSTRRELWQYVDQYHKQPWHDTEVNDVHRRFWWGLTDNKIEDLLDRRRMHHKRLEWMRYFEEKERAEREATEELRAQLRAEKAERDAQKEALKAERAKVHAVRMQLLAERRRKRQQKCVSKALAQEAEWQSVKEEMVQVLMEDQEKWVYHPDELQNRRYRRHKHDLRDWYTKFN
eukprot:TRINITY_DN5557_c0_g1_i1.p1 TRINITY_DN5557_c0_g1~~TRINITY_DN5557_c0_g1_i1.p1  ORF type:complete len:224 (+),score=90.31 TRINITY_DN5557_c0_g1_i1:46-717(+)